MIDKTLRVSSFKREADKIIPRIQEDLITVYISNVEAMLSVIALDTKNRDVDGVVIKNEFGIAKLVMDNTFNLQISCKIQLSHIQEVHPIMSKNYSLSEVGSTWLARFMTTELLASHQRINEVLTGYAISPGQQINIRDRFKTRL